MNLERQPTCADRVQASCDSTLMLDPQATDAYITEEGTTSEGNHFRTIRIGDEKFKIETLIRDDGSAIFEANEDEIRDTMRDRFNEYALDFSYVASNTFSDQPIDYARYQISWGGPSTEIRFYCDAERKPFRVEYWYLDWFDGASVDITDHPVTALLQSELGFDDWLKDHNEFWSVDA